LSCFGIFSPSTKISPAIIALLAFSLVAKNLFLPAVYPDVLYLFFFKPVNSPLKLVVSE
jgi:hypothetical protein